MQIIEWRGFAILIVMSRLDDVTSDTLTVTLASTFFLRSRWSSMIVIRMSSVGAKNLKSSSEIYEEWRSDINSQAVNSPFQHILPSKCSRIWLSLDFNRNIDFLLWTCSLEFNLEACKFKQFERVKDSGAPTGENEFPSLMMAYAAGSTHHLLDCNIVPQSAQTSETQRVKLRITNEV